MARKTVTRKVCDACLYDVPAEHVVQFCYCGQTIELDLCNRHDAAFHDELTRWLNAGAVVAGPHPRDEPEWEELRRMRIVPEVVVVPAPEEPEAKPVELPPGTTRDPVFLDLRDWHLTSHARQRMAERDISADLVASTIHHPRFTKPSMSTKYPKARILIRDRAKVVVLPDEKVILTVCRRNEEIDDAEGWGADRERSVATN